jgi:SpoVK/Ycf46/Vps4 family AAA+-type ATPase
VSADRDPPPELLQRLPTQATWDDLVLPAGATQSLRDLAEHARLHGRVREHWGLSDKSSRGKGPCALFSGPSGTGKSMAAEILANDLGLDLLRVDLSAVVSKYIGETEKNLGRIFDAAERSGAVLLFDEADALLGSRSDVKDSHDRYANLEVAYLLQRLEHHEGLTILTTNRRHAIDPAFARRLYAIVGFPIPDDACRESIWRRIFPAGAEIEPLDYRRLAQLEITGGTIRGIATRAALRAAAQATPITMPLILEAAAAELSKRGKASDAEDA